MKIRIINPDSGHSEAELRARVSLLKPFVRPDTELSMVCPQQNNLCIDSSLDEALDASEIVSLALEAQNEGYDAVCLWCFSDPAIDACRELLHIPVVGGAQSSVLLACQLALSYSVLVTSRRRIPQKNAFIRALGGDPARLASVRSVEIPPDSALNRSAMIKILEENGRRCVEEDGAGAVVLGCLSFAAMGGALTKALGVPVLDPAAVLVTTAESLVLQGLCHSKKSWPTPEPAERFWGAGRVKN